MIRKIRGVEDILPPEIYGWEKINTYARRLFGIFGFSEIRTPIIEFSELFRRSIGHYTDIVSKEMYTFSDRKGRHLTLRPEGTASVIRAFIENGMQAPKRFFYIGPMFRYEKPQSGRQRQFYQLGAEIIGEGSAYADAEIIIMLDYFFRKIGLDNFEIVTNSVGCPKCRPDYEAALRDYFSPLISRMCADCQFRFDKNIFRILDCKNEKCRIFIKKAPAMSSFLCHDCAEQYSEFKQILNSAQVKFREDERLVRGLDYYTHTAFEIVTSALGAQNTIAAGGRYNNLIKELGGKDIPAVGMAIGMERLSMLLNASGSDIFNTRPSVCVAFTNAGYRGLAFGYLLRIRKSGLKAQSFLEKPSLKAQLKMADKTGSEWVVILGEEEVRTGRFILRDMGTGVQRTYLESELEIELKRRVDDV